MIKPIVSIVSVMTVIAALAGCGSSTNSDGAAVADDSGGAGASFTVVAAESYCVPSGIDDVYTGDGHVTFFVTIRNDGDASGTASVTPVRHYDDGEMNESAMDTMMSDEVAAGDTTKFRSTAMTYKAHSHEIVDCGLIVDGGDEVPITVG